MFAAILAIICGACVITCCNSGDDNPVVSPTGDSLKVVSDDVMALGYCLKIYDAYRPQKATLTTPTTQSPSGLRRPRWLFAMFVMFSAKVFPVLEERNRASFTVVGGWSTTPDPLQVGLTCLPYPFFSDAAFLKRKLKFFIGLAYISLYLSKFAAKNYNNPAYEKEVISICNAVGNSSLHR